MKTANSYSSDGPSRTDIHGLGANPSINDLLSEGRVGDAVKVGASRLWNKVTGKGQRPTPSAPAAPKPPIATANATASEDAEMIQPSSSRVTPSPGMQVLKDLRMSRAEREAGKKAVGMAGGGPQPAYGPYGRKANVSPQQLLEAGLKPMGRMRRPPTPARGGDGQRGRRLPGPHGTPAEGGAPDVCP